METEAVDSLQKRLGISVHAMAKLGYVTYHGSTKKYVLTKKGKNKLKRMSDRRAVRAVARRYGVVDLVAKDFLKRKR